MSEHFEAWRSWNPMNSSRSWWIGSDVPGFRFPRGSRNFRQEWLIREKEMKLPLHPLQIQSLGGKFSSDFVPMLKTFHFLFFFVFIQLVFFLFYFFEFTKVCTIVITTELDRRFEWIRPGTGPMSDLIRSKDLLARWTRLGQCEPDIFWKTGQFPVLIFNFDF